MRILPRQEWVKSPAGSTHLARDERYSIAGITDDAGEEEDEERRDVDATISVENVDKRYPTGVIVAILRRNVTEIIASVPMLRDKKADSLSLLPSGAETKEEFILVVPLDKKLPKFRILTRQYKRLSDQRIVVIWDNWPLHSKYPNGHFNRSLGVSSDWRVEIECILMKNNIPHRPFSMDALACLPQDDTLQIDVAG